MRDLKKNLFKLAYPEFKAVKDAETETANANKHGQKVGTLKVDMAKLALAEVVMAIMEDK